MGHAAEIAARSHGLSLEAYRAEVDAVLWVFFDRWDPPTLEARQRLAELAYGALGTEARTVVAAARREAVRSWLLGTYVPTVLDVAGLKGQAAIVRGVAVGRLGPWDEQLRPVRSKAEGLSAKQESSWVSVRRGVTAGCKKAWQSAAGYVVWDVASGSSFDMDEATLADMTKGIAWSTFGWVGGTAAYVPGQRSSAIIDFEAVLAKTSRVAEVALQPLVSALVPLVFDLIETLMALDPS